MNKTGIIYGINGPVIYLKGDPGFKISEMVYVGKENLVGEVIGSKKGMTTVQVFEETTGLRPGETVTGTGDAISVLLGPGIIHNIFDGIQRPLEEIAKNSGKYILHFQRCQCRFSGHRKKMAHTYYSQGGGCCGSRHYHRRDTGNSLHSSQIHGSAHHYRRYCNQGGSRWRYTHSWSLS